MKLPLQVSFHGIDRSEALENLIAKEVEGLHKFDADLISCRVAVESEGRHQNQGRECSVRVSLNAPGHEFIMNTKNEDAHAAVRAAFDSLARQVKDNAARRVYFCLPFAFLFVSISNIPSQLVDFPEILTRV